MPFSTRGTIPTLRSAEGESNKFASPGTARAPPCERRRWARTAGAPEDGPARMRQTIRRNKIEDLMNVKGIGEKSFLKLKPYLTVSEKATAGTPQR